MQCFPSPGGNSCVLTRAFPGGLLLVLCLLSMVQCFPSPGGNRVLTRVSVSYLWCNVSPLLVVTVSLLVLLSLISGAMFPLSWW